MRILAENSAKAEWAEAVRRLEQHRNTVELPSEPPCFTTIVGLDQLCTLHEQLTDLFNRQCEHQHASNGNAAGDRV